MKLFDLGMIVPEGSDKGSDRGIELSFGEFEGDILLMAEIRRSPVDMVVYQFIPLFIGFHTSQVVPRFQSSTVSNPPDSNVWLQNVIFLQILQEIQFVVSVRKIVSRITLHDPWIMSLEKRTRGPLKNKQLSQSAINYQSVQQQEVNMFSRENQKLLYRINKKRNLKIQRTSACQ